MPLKPAMLSPTSSASQCEALQISLSTLTTPSLLSKCHSLLSCITNYNRVYIHFLPKIPKIIKIFFRPERTSFMTRRIKKIKSQKSSKSSKSWKSRKNIRVSTFSMCLCNVKSSSHQRLPHLASSFFLLSSSQMSLPHFLLCFSPLHASSHHAFFALHLYGKSAHPYAFSSPSFCFLHLRCLPSNFSTRLT